MYITTDGKRVLQFAETPEELNCDHCATEIARVTPALESEIANFGKRVVIRFLDKKDNVPVYGTIIEFYEKLAEADNLLKPEHAWICIIDGVIFHSKSLKEFVPFISRIRFAESESNVWRNIQRGWSVFGMATPELIKEIRKTHGKADCVAIGVWNRQIIYGTFREWGEISK